MVRRLLPLVVTASWLAYLWWGKWSEATPAVWIASAAALAGAVGAAVIPRTSVHGPMLAAAGLVATLGGFVALRVIGHWPFAWDAMPDRRYAALIATLDLAIAVGLVYRALWARWGAIAVAAGGMLGGGLNSLHWIGARGETPWLAAVGVFGGLTICCLLLRDAVREHFAKHHALWAIRDPLVRSARWAAIASFVAAPMLVLYALGQPVAPSTVTSALVLAPLLALGGGLVVARRTAGIAVLATAGVALIAQTIATVSAASDRPVAEYYAAFWLPAALLGLVAGAIALYRAKR